MFGCLALVLVTGCDVGQANTHPTPSTSASAPAASPSTISTLSCRLPVISPTTADSEAPGGWLTFPSGNFARDPASHAGRLNNHVPSYDRAFGRWVPVEYPDVAPDGTRYILHNDRSVGNDFYVVDVRT